MSGLANPRRRRRREPNCGMDPNFPSYEGQLCDLREAARALDLQVQELRASTDAEIDLAFETIARQRIAKSDHRHRLLLRARRGRPSCRRAAECSQQLPPSDGDCHTPLPCEVRKGNDTTPRACSLAVQGSRRAGCWLLSPLSWALAKGQRQHPRRTERARRPTFMIRPTHSAQSDRDCRVCSRFDISRRRRPAPRETSPDSRACTKGGMLGSRPRTSHRR